MTRKPILYTSPNCPECDRVKVWFSRRAVPFEERNIMLNAQARQELREMGFEETPVTLMQGEPIPGYDPERFEERIGPGIGT